MNDLFNDTPAGRYWYRGGFNPKAIGALLPSVAICLVISFIPSLHEVANFSWFIGAGLAAGCYRFIAREDRETEEVSSWRSNVAVQKDSTHQQWVTRRQQKADSLLNRLL